MLEEELRLDTVLREVPGQLELLADQNLSDAAVQRKLSDFRIRLDMANLRKRKIARERARLEGELGERLYAAWDIYRQLLAAVLAVKEASIEAALAPFCGGKTLKDFKQLDIHMLPCFAPLHYAFNIVRLRPSLRDGHLVDHVEGFLAHVQRHAKALGLT